MGPGLLSVYYWRAGASQPSRATGKFYMYVYISESESRYSLCRDGAISQQMKGLSQERRKQVLISQAKSELMNAGFISHITWSTSVSIHDKIINVGKIHRYT